MDFKKEQLVKLSKGFTKADMQGTQLEEFSHRPRITRQVEKYDIASVSNRIEADYQRKKAYLKAYYDEFVYMFITPERYVEIPQWKYEFMLNTTFPSTWILTSGKRGELIKFIREKHLIKK